MKLIIGLGNPGSRYAHNRHNIGFMCISHYAKLHRIGFEQKESLSRTGHGTVNGVELILARPQTGMNLSGEAVRRLVDKYRIGLDDLIVIHDDLDLPLGKIRISYYSGGGGHRGVASVIRELGGRQDFTRIRIGIGRPEAFTLDPVDKEARVIAYVLSDFTEEEKRVMDGVISVVSEAINCLLQEGLVTAMNRFN